MYWFIGSLIIIAMIGALAVADNMMLPLHPFVLDVTNTPILSSLLVILAIVLWLIAHFKTPLASVDSTSQTSAGHLSHHTKWYSRIIRYGFVIILAIGLIIGSAVQALLGHQRAEVTKVNEPMRVTAWVTIEGLSDSVYDAATGSGYRQVAIISHLSPLVSELTAQELTEMTPAGLQQYKNSLNKNINSHSDGQAIKHRVLLNAYPKPSSKAVSNDIAKNAANNAAKNSQLTTLNHLQPGHQMLMSLTLRPLATSEQVLQNPSGFDSYRWLRARHIDGMADIMAVGRPLASAESSLLATASRSYLQRFRTRIDQGRWQLRQHFYKDWPVQTTAQQQAKAVTLSLLTGDRSLINRETKELYQLAGISHLLAISGTHVLFLAIVLAGMVVRSLDRLWPVIYRYLPRWQVRWWVMVIAAFIYALFTGFDVPAARTAWTLLAIGLVRLTLLPISTMRVLLALAVLMAWQDPYVLWQAGYWLSFIAVALLLKYEDTSSQYKRSATFFDAVSFDAASLDTVGSNTNTAGFDKTVVIKAALNRGWLGFKRLFKLQFWLFITLLPITLLLFGKASLWGLVINLFAIGLFGWVIVPLNLLAGLGYLLSPAIADGIWALVSAIIAELHELMSWLTSLAVLSEAWLYTPISTAILLMMLLAISPWLLPRGLLSRWLALPPLTLLIMTVYAQQQSLTMQPSLYILPTGDRYVSAALLQYPINESSSVSTSNNTTVSWLFLADHRQMGAQAMPSRRTAEQLAKVFQQQLGSLAVDKLAGVIVQSGSIGLTDTLADDSRQRDGAGSHLKNAELLPLTVAQLNQYLPISQYWQAGRSDRWPALQQAYQIVSQSADESGPDIAVQRCEQGKRWQLAQGELSIQALSGWREVGDPSVWDCTVAIDSDLPIQILRYNAADPLNSLPATEQMLISGSQSSQQLSQKTKQKTSAKSRLILNTDTHQRVWQMWQLLCPIEPVQPTGADVSNITWLGDSTSSITTDVLSRQKINKVITYDDKQLAAALALYADAGSEK